MFSYCIGMWFGEPHPFLFLDECLFDMVSEGFLVWCCVVSFCEKKLIL